MQQDQKVTKHCGCGDEVENSLQRTGCAQRKASTALRTYMGVLILFATAIAYVICVALALKVTSALTHLWLSLRKI